MRMAEMAKTSDKRRAPFLIGVAGGTASGKSTVCEKIMDSLRQCDLENVERQVGRVNPSIIW